MKFFTAVIVSLFSLSTFAHVGEYVEYKFSTPQGSGLWKQKVIDYSSARGSYLVESKYTMGGASQTETAEVSSDELITREKISQILIFCEAIGGAKEVIGVNGINFDTCRVENSNSPVSLVEFGVQKSDAGQVWIADIPVTGVLMMTSEDGSMIMNSYDWN